MFEALDEPALTSPQRPHFIGIGSPKAGTSWLDSVLRQHPQVWMPPVKELNFFFDHFNCLAMGDQRRYFSRDLAQRARWRRLLRTELKRAMRYPSPQNVEWALRFLLGKRSMKHYEGLFFPANKRVCGEISPNYCMIGADHTAEIVNAFPNLRAILLVRNPIERAWSHCKMELATRVGRSMSDVPVAEIERFLLRDSGVTARNDYLTIIQNWSGSIGEERFFIGLFDDIATDPLSFAQRIFNFLGVSPDVAQSINVNDVVFPGPSDALPGELRERLAQRYGRAIESLCIGLGRSELVDLWLGPNQPRKPGPVN